MGVTDQLQVFPLALLIWYVLFENPAGITSQFKSFWNILIPGERVTLGSGAAGFGGYLVHATELENSLSCHAPVA